jgi:hypothetical protein
VFGFAPFRVRIKFKRTFLTETGLATEAQLIPPVVLSPATEYWPRRDGITFTVLRLGLSSSDENLIYWNDTRSFSTRLEHLLSFSEFERPAPPDSATYRIGKATVTPWLELERRPFGLEVWASSGLTSERKLAAFIPNCMFDAPRLRQGKITRRKREAVLKSHGWEEEKASDLGEYGQIPGDFQHRYLSVNVSCI